MANPHTVRSTEISPRPKDTRSAEAVLLRAQIKSRPDLRVAIANAIKTTLEKHDLTISDQLVRELAIAAAEELEIGGDHVIV